MQCGNRDRHIEPDIDIGTLISIHTIQILVLTRFHQHDTFISQKYKPPVKSSVKIEKKNPLEVLKAAGYSELDNCGASIIAFLSLRLYNFENEFVLVFKKKPIYNITNTFLIGQFWSTFANSDTQFPWIYRSKYSRFSFIYTG
jgi:hypothetical protein